MICLFKKQIQSSRKLKVAHIIL